MRLTRIEGRDVPEATWMEAAPCPCGSCDNFHIIFRDANRQIIAVGAMSLSESIDFAADVIAKSKAELLKRGGGTS